MIETRGELEALYRKVAVHLSGRADVKLYFEDTGIGAMGCMRSVNGVPTIQISYIEGMDSELSTVLHEIAHARLHFGNLAPSHHRPTQGQAAPRNERTSHRGDAMENEANALRDTWLKYAADYAWKFADPGYLPGIGAYLRALLTWPGKPPANKLYGKLES
jgi:hypothetical protein